MSSNMFKDIVGKVGQFWYFQQKSNAAGILGATPEQKISVALRMLAYGTPGDAHDEYFRLSETVANDSLGHSSNHESPLARKVREECG